MSRLSADTHPKFEQLQIQLIRRMPSWKKFSAVDGLNETVRTLALSGLKERFPDAGPQELHLMLAVLILGEELASRVYDHAR